MTNRHAKNLRRTRADMLGTDDEEHYWECHDAADEIDRLQAVVGAAKEMASDYEAYEPRGDNWLDYPLHDVEILGAFKRRLAALEDK